METKESLSLRVLPETRKALLHAAVDRRTSASALVDRLTADYLDSLDETKPA